MGSRLKGQVKHNCSPSYFIFSFKAAKVTNCKSASLNANKASIGQLNSQPIRNILKSHEVAGASALMHATLNIGQPGLDLALNVSILLLMSPSSF